MYKEAKVKRPTLLKQGNINFWIAWPNFKATAIKKNNIRKEPEKKLCKLYWGMIAKVFEDIFQKISKHETKRITYAYSSKS